MLGGRRPGSGRPKGSKATHTLKSEEIRKYLVERIAEQMEPLINTQLDLALGLYYEETDKDGVKRIYQQKPSKEAARYLLDQAIGKSKDMIETSTAPSFDLITLLRGAEEEEKEGLRPWQVDMVKRNR